MVSPSVKSPPLSYAERARKAKNIKTSISAPPPQSLISKSIPIASSSSTASTAAALSVTVSNSIDTTALSSSTTSSSSPQLEAITDVSLNTTKSTVSPQLAAQALSIVAAHTTTPPKPPPNVWSLRIEKMAAGRAASFSQNTSASNATASASRSQPPPVNGKPPPSQVVKSTKNSVNLSPNAARTTVAATTNAAPPLDDSFVVRAPLAVRPSMRPAQLQSDPTARDLRDPESWPEVGKPSVAAENPVPSSLDSLVPPLPPSDSVQPSISPRKNDKKKWVPMPLEELQAAADAALKAQVQPNSSSRKQSTRSSANNTGGNNSNTGGNTRNPSGRTSAAHSRAQSRAASMHSSPRGGTGRNTGGRRLPGDDAAVNDSSSPSGHSSFSVSDASGYLVAPATAINPSTSNPNANSNFSSSTSSQLRLPPPYPTSTTATLPTHTFHASAPTFYPQSQRSPMTSSTHLPPQHPASPRSVPLGLAVNTSTSSSISNPNQPATYSSPVPTAASYGPHSHGHAAFYSPATYEFSGPSHGLPLPSTSSLFAMGAPSINGMPTPPQYASPPPPPMWNGAGPVSGYQPQQQPGYPIPVSTAASHSPLAPSININLVSTATPDADALRAEESHANGSLSSSISSITSTSTGTREMMFGSIPSSGPSASGSDPAASGINGRPSTNGHANENGLKQDSEEEKKLGAVNPKGEEQYVNGKDSSASAKPKGRDGKGKKGKPSAGSAGSSSPSKERPAEKVERNEKGMEGAADLHGSVPAGQAIQNLQQAEVKWKFGTTTSTPPVQRQISLPEADDTAQSSLAARLQAPSQQQQNQQLRASHGHEQQQRVGMLHQSNTVPVMLNADRAEGSTSASGHAPPYSAYPMDPRGSASFAHLPHPTTDMGLGLEATHPMPAPVLGPVASDPDLAVKDYGYGFGVPRLRQWEVEQHATEGAYEQNPEVPNTMREPAHGRGGAAGGDIGHVNGRGGRRGGFGGGPGGGRGYGGGERGGGFGGGRRGRGPNGFARGYGRGGFPRGGSQRGVHNPPPFTVTPPQHLQSLGPMNDGAYYIPPRPQIETYLPPSNGYDAYGPISPQTLAPMPPIHAPLPQNVPPVPVPLSTISFPLDHVRYYLLGQLEYYLSPQNMAQDFFLRQRMDAQGWIPISLIASFRRVKLLTMEPQLVREVLTLSTTVQVHGNMVRMREWKSFVLPDAAPSSVEDQPLPSMYQNVGAYYGETSIEQQLNYQQHEPHGQQPPVGPLTGDADTTALAHGEQKGAQNGINDSHAEGELVNGHTSKDHYSSASEHDQEEDEDEDDVVFVM